MSSDAQDRWDALEEAVGEIAAAPGYPAGFTAAFAAVGQIGRGVDLDEVLNALHIPDDAGEHAAALKRMLLRIPDGWGRSIRCSRGWYPIVVELDQQLSALFPDYELHQVKEKFGCLRFYWAVGARVTDPADPPPEVTELRDDASDAEQSAAASEWRSRYAAWQERLDVYLETEDGAARQAALEHRFKLAEELVEAAEQRASVTCELCGQPGEISSRRGWLQTVCADCAQEHGYAI